VGTFQPIETIAIEDGPGASNSESSSESDEDEVVHEPTEDSSVHQCALAQIQATNKTGRRQAGSDAPESIKTMVTCWELHKNNKNKRAFAATCYHKMESNERGTPEKKIKKMMIDTGANLTLMDGDAETVMTESKNSKIRIEVADKRCIQGAKDGTVRMHVMKLDQKSHLRATTSMTDTGIVMSHKVTTIENLSRQLFSVDAM